MKARLNLKYFVNGCLWMPFFYSNSFQTPLNLILSIRFSHRINLKLEQLSLKKVLKLDLFGNCFSDLFTEVEIWY